MPPPPSTSSANQHRSINDEDEDEKRRSIYGELRTYLSSLKLSSTSRPSSSSDQPQVNESGDKNEGPVIDFPDNFDDVVSLMSRADLEFGEDGDGPEVEVGADTPFSNGPPTETSVDWSKFALSEGISKLGVYYKYEQELKRDQSDREKIEKALAKVQLLDRKIEVREMEHGARIGEYKKEVEGLEKEIDAFENEVRLSKGGSLRLLPNVALYTIRKLTTRRFAPCLTIFAICFAHRSTCHSTEYPPLVQG